MRYSREDSRQSGWSFSILLRIVELAAQRLPQSSTVPLCFSILLRIVELAEIFVRDILDGIVGFSILLRIVELAVNPYSPYEGLSLVSVSSCGS